MDKFFDQIIGDPWKESIVCASVPLWKYNEQNIPICNASGCIIDYEGSRFLLSIAHSSVAKTVWNFEILSAVKNQYNNEWETVFQPINMNFLTEFTFLPDINDFTEQKMVDFTYRKIPQSHKSYHVIHRFEDGKVIGAYRTIFKPNFDFKPSSNKKYGFYGNIKFDGVEGRRIVFQHRLESELKYIGIEDNHHVFLLPHEYGGHNNYLGCSGAPIIDEDGNLVSLVSFGKKETNTIHGIDISRYKSALDIEAKSLIK